MDTFPGVRVWGLHRIDGKRLQSHLRFLMIGTSSFELIQQILATAKPISAIAGTELGRDMNEKVRMLKVWYTSLNAFAK